MSPDGWLHDEGNVYRSPAASTAGRDGPVLTGLTDRDDGRVDADRTANPIVRLQSRVRAGERQLTLRVRAVGNVRVNAVLADQLAQRLARAHVLGFRPIADGKARD